MVGNLGDVLERMNAIAAKIKETDPVLADELCREVSTLRRAFMPDTDISPSASSAVPKP